MLRLRTAKPRSPSSSGVLLFCRIKRLGKRPHLQLYQRRYTLLINAFSARKGKQFQLIFPTSRFRCFFLSASSDFFKAPLKEKKVRYRRGLGRAGPGTCSFCSGPAFASFWRQTHRQCVCLQILVLQQRKFSVARLRPTSNLILLRKYPWAIFIFLFI